MSSERRSQRFDVCRPAGRLTAISLGVELAVWLGGCTVLAVLFLYDWAMARFEGNAHAFGWPVLGSLAMLAALAVICAALLAIRRQPLVGGVMDEVFYDAALAVSIVAHATGAGAAMWVLSRSPSGVVAFCATLLAGLFAAIAVGCTDELLRSGDRNRGS